MAISFGYGVPASLERPVLSDLSIMKTAATLIRSLWLKLYVSKSISIFLGVGTVDMKTMIP